MAFSGRDARLCGLKGVALVAKCPVCPSMWSSPPDSSVGGRRYDGIGAAAKKAKVELRGDFFIYFGVSTVFGKPG